MSQEMPRLAIVQHGDYREGLSILDTDASETYFGMKRSVALLEEFLKGTLHKVISVDAASYRVQRNHGEIVGFQRPKWRRFSKLPWSLRVYKEVTRFKPTHLLLRTGGLLAYPTLRWANRNSVNTLVVMAGFIRASKTYERLLIRSLISELNNPGVYLATNHRRPATNSTIAAGVNSNKVLAWDFSGLPDPKDQPAKELQVGQPISIVFAGQIKEGKGVGDLVDAIVILHARKIRVKLIVCGDGELLPHFRNRCRGIEDTYVEFRGRVGNDEVQRLMKMATFVCVPSRRSSSEGFPFVVTEAFSSRTPVIASDHPSITELLKDGEGIRIVPSNDPDTLAHVIEQLSKNPDEYFALSNSTAIAHSRISYDITFDDLLHQWRASW